jgi:ParB family chromosome partitioning protein
MPKRKGFYDNAAADTGLDLVRERNVETLLQPLIEPRRTVQRDLRIDRIRPNPFQARRTFNVAELAQAIQVQGFISRLRVRPDPVDPGYFQLVFGERRLRAAQAAGLVEVPCEIAEHTDAELIEIGLAENIQREDLDPLEEAEAFQVFLDQRGYSIRSLAERIAKDKGYIENRLALLRAPRDVQNMVAARPDTIRAARELAKLPDADARGPLIDGLITGKLNLSAVSAIVREAAADPQTAASIVAARMTGRQAATAQTSGRRQERGDVEQELARDAQLLADAIARWQARATQLNDQQRQQLVRYVEGHLQALEQLMETLR